MKIDNKSVILNDSTFKVLKLEVFIPLRLMDYIITDKIWIKAINELNDQLDNRESSTQIVAGKKMDIFGLKSNLTRDGLITGIYLDAVVKGEDEEEIKRTPFCLTGQLIFKDGSDKVVEDMFFKNLTYGEGGIKILPEKD